MKIKYVTSRLFDYARKMGADEGQPFAEDYGWPTITLDEIINSECDIAIVDQRFLAEELVDLRAAICNSRITFVLRLVDPYWDHARNHYWYRFVDEMLDHPRVHAMLTYQPAEITALFATRVRRSRFIFAPYVYRPEKELPIDHDGRRHALLVSGHHSSRIYPVRSRIRRVATFYPPLSVMSETLPHPGYPDLTGGRHRHTIIGDKYIKYLSGYRFASVCSSRCRLEFLKYRECAYAGVVPVGDMPATLLDCPDDAWVPWRRNFLALTQSLRKMRDTGNLARRFRAFLRARRHVDEMRKWMGEQLADL